MNEILTAYLRTYHAMRGGRVSASDAMTHVLGLMSGVMATQKLFGKLASSANPFNESPAPKGKDAHA